jgi:photosystem II stability/assembly factor-like uncharacterized protein
MNKRIFPILSIALTAALLLLAVSQASAQGNDWQAIPLPPGIQFLSLEFVGGSGWAAGFDYDAWQGVIFHTGDEGKTWSEQFRWPANGIFFYSIAFTDEQAGVAAGGKSTSDRDTPVIIRTADGGQTWEAAALPPENGVLHELIPVPGGGIWALGRDRGRDGAEVTWYSADGLAWSARPLPPAQEHEINALAFPSATTAYLVGKQGGEASAPLAMKSSDGGQTWETLTLPLAEGALSGVYFLDEQTGFACGSSGDFGIILKTSDGGATWAELARLSGSKVTLEQIAFANPLYGSAIGWILGEAIRAVAYETSDGGVTWNKTYITSSEGAKIAYTGFLLDTAILSIYDMDTDTGELVVKPLPPYTPTEPPLPTEPPAPTEPPVPNIHVFLAIEPSSASGDTGQKFTFTAKASDTDGNILPPQNPIWSCSGNCQKGSCSGYSCNVKFLSEGEQTVTVQDYGIQAAASVSVIKASSFCSCGAKPLPLETSLSLLALAFGAVYFVQRKVSPPKD